MSSSSNDNPLFDDLPDSSGGTGPVVAEATPSSNANLMASLLDTNGTTSTTTNGTSGGLFGNQDSNDNALFADDPPPFATTDTTSATAVNNAGKPPPAPTQASVMTPQMPTQPPPVVPQQSEAPVVPPNPAPAPSLLMQSGLLPGGTSGGLFDEVEQQEQEQAAAAAKEEADRKQQETIRQQQQQQQQQAAQQKAQEELQRQQQQALQQQQTQQTQQLTDQMQSVYLGNSSMAPPSSQQQQPSSSYGGGAGGGMAQSMPTPAYGYGQPQSNHHAPAGYLNATGGMSSPSPSPYGAASAMVVGTTTPGAGGPVQAGFYRDHGAPSAYHPPPPSPVQPGQPTQRYYQPTQSPSVLAGMHNGPVPQQAVLGRPPTSSLPVTEPPPVQSFYAQVKVSEPLLIPGQALFGNAPHWSYQIATTLQAVPGQGAGGVWWVRRRFRHVVALEDRLREECPGAVLPPRPDKHATRALEEASTQQSAEFAVQRAVELEVYLNQLIKHPYAFSTHTLRLFLSLQDDLGTAWPEVSNNAFTRLANAGVGAAVKVSEQTQATKFPWQDSMGHIDDYGEEDAELMALANQEQVRMGAVLQAVPKLEGAITLLREGAELRGATGMEMSRMAKEMEASDKELSYPMELVAGGMLRSGRRSKRMSLELAAALETFVQQYKLCRYEKMAFADRRVAIMRRNKERGKASQYAHQYMMQQQRQMYQQPYGGGAPYGQQMNPDALASDAVQECNEIGHRIKSEVNRIAWHRRQEWKAAVKVVASANKEAITENVAIWESVRESFLQAFPEE